MKVVKLYEESQFKVKRKKDKCYDCYAIVLDSDMYHTDDKGEKFYNIEPGQTKRVSIGVKIGFSEGTGGKLEERSGLASQGIAIGGGELDDDFIGEVFAIVRNEGKRPFQVYTGDRICQLKLEKNIHEEVEEVEELEETERGENAFGSSGLK